MTLIHKLCPWCGCKLEPKILQIEDKIIGTFALCPVNKTECELQKFTVKKEYRGIGLGLHLLDQVIRIASDLGYKGILLFSHDNLKEATELYNKKGFKTIEKHPDLIDPTGRCSFIMNLNIN